MKITKKQLKEYIDRQVALKEATDVDPTIRRKQAATEAAKVVADIYSKSGGATMPSGMVTMLTRHIYSALEKFDNPNQTMHDF